MRVDKKVEVFDIVCLSSCTCLSFTFLKLIILFLGLVGGEVDLSLGCINVIGSPSESSCCIGGDGVVVERGGVDEEDEVEEEDGGGVNFEELFNFMSFDCSDGFKVSSPV